MTNKIYVAEEYSGRMTDPTEAIVIDKVRNKLIASCYNIKEAEMIADALNKCYGERVNECYEKR